MKTTTFKLEDNEKINEIFGQRGTLHTEAEIEKSDSEGHAYSVNYNFQWESSFTEERVLVSEDQETELIVALATLGFFGERLYMGEANVSSESATKIDVYLVFSADEWQSNASYELEGVCSSLEKAHDVVVKILKEYPDCKAVVKTTHFDENSFSDIEVFSFESGLEWKSEASSSDYGYLALNSSEDLSDEELEAVKLYAQKMIDENNTFKDKDDAINSFARHTGISREKVEHSGLITENCAETDDVSDSDWAAYRYKDTKEVCDKGTPIGIIVAWDRDKGLCHLFCYSNIEFAY